MKWNVLFLVFICCMLSSCAAIKYGKSTDVVINGQKSSTPIHLTVVGKKHTYNYSSVEFPYNLNVKHKDIPMRIYAFSDSILYDPISINGKTVGSRDQTAWGITALTALTASTVCALTYEDDDPTDSKYGHTIENKAVRNTGLALLLGSVGCFSGALLSTFEVPESKVFFMQGKPNEDYGNYGNIINSTQWKASVLKRDAYDLLKDEEFIKAYYIVNYLFKIVGEPVPEMFYLRGVCFYNFGKYKDAMKDFERALSYENLPVEFMLQITKYQDSITKIEQNRRAENARMVANVAMSLYQVTSSVLQAQNEYVASDYYIGGNDSESALNDDIPAVFHPDYVAQFCTPKYTYDAYGNMMVSYPDWSNYLGQANNVIQNQVSDVSGKLKSSQDHYFSSQGESLQGLANTYNWTTQLDQQFWATPMYPEAFIDAEVDELGTSNSQKIEDGDYSESGSMQKDASGNSSMSDNDSSTSDTSIGNSSSRRYSNNKVVKDNNNNNIQHKKLDSRQQYQTNNVSSHDYNYKKNITLYNRDGNEALKFKNAKLYQKGAYYYVKIDSTYYPVQLGTWNVFNRYISYGARKIYFRM